MFDIKELFKVFLNALSQLTIRLAGGITTFIITVLIVGSLGLLTLGSFVKITAFVALFYLLVDFGINTIYLRDYFKKVEELFGNVLLLRLILAFLVFVIVLIITFFLPNGTGIGFSVSEKLGIVIFSLTLFTEAVLISFSGLVQKKLLQRALLIPTIASSLCVLLGVLYGVRLNNLYIILISYPLGDILQILLIFLFVKRAMEFSLLPVGFGTFTRNTIRASGPIALMLLLNVIYFRVDTFILSIYKPTTDVGIYGFAYKVFEFLIAFPTFLSASVFPILIINKNNREVFFRKIKLYAGILFVSAVIISVVVFLFAPVINLLKDNLDPAVVPLQVLCFALPFFFLTSLFQWVLLLEGKIKQLIGIYFFTMLTNIILNLIFIPVFSYNGAATVTVVTEALVFLLMTLSFAFSTFKKY